MAVPAERPARRDRVLQDVEVGCPLRLEWPLPEVHLRPGIDVGLARDVDAVEAPAPRIVVVTPDRRRRQDLPAVQRRRRRRPSSAPGPTFDFISPPSPDETASTTRIGSSPARCAASAASRADGASKTKKQISSSGTWIERSKRTRVPLLRQLLRGRACPPLAGGALSRLAAGEIGLDEVARHALDATAGATRVETSERLNFARPTGSSVQPAGELGARADAELGVDVGQVARDRPLAEEQRGGDLPVRPALGDERGDAALGRRQPFLARAPADPARARRAPSRPRWPPRAARSRRAPRAIASRAARFCRARRRTMPSASSARARPNGIADRLVLRDRLLAGGTAACSTSPRAAATRPRHRVTCASTHSRPSRAASASQTSSTRTASSIRPSSSSSLDVVGGPPADARLAPPELGGLPVGLAEPVRGRGRVAAPERDEPEDRQVVRRMEPELLLGEVERSLAMLARELELAAMDGDRGDREVVLRHLEPVLDRDVVGAGGVVGRELPAPGPELDPGEAPERAGAPRLVALAPLLGTRARAAARASSSCVDDERERVRDRRGRLLHQLLVADGGRESCARAA